MKEKHEPDNIGIIAYTDGACRGNPGPAGCAAVLVRDNRVIVKAGKYLGTSTNNRAEYAGLILALTKAAEVDGCRGITVYTDSELMAKQVSGKYKVKDPELQRLKRQALDLAAVFDSFEIHSIPREQNSLADGLANKAVDAGLAKK